MTPYEPRRIRSCGPRSHLGYRLKLYSIAPGTATVDLERFESGLALVESVLPTPPVTPERPGVGFLIAHQGVDADYAVLAFWDRENELPLRIALRERASSSWRWSLGSESICVWDLEVVWFERQVYVRTMLDGGSAEDYMSHTLIEEIHP